MKHRFYLWLARRFWKAGQLVFATADKAGEYDATMWLQRHLDRVGNWLMGLAAKYTMKAYWMIDPDAEWTS